LNPGFFCETLQKRNGNQCPDEALHFRSAAGAAFFSFCPMTFPASVHQDLHSLPELKGILELRKRFLNSEYCPLETGIFGTALRKKAKREFSVLCWPAITCSLIPDLKGLSTFVILPENKSRRKRFFTKMSTLFNPTYMYEAPGALNRPKSRALTAGHLADVVSLARRRSVWVRTSLGTIFVLFFDSQSPRKMTSRAASSSATS
jgi:hypothetical protein